MQGLTDTAVLIWLIWIDTSKVRQGKLRLGKARYSIYLLRELGSDEGEIFPPNSRYMYHKRN